jgi:uncharacterized protein (AIM24 family)
MQAHEIDYHIFGEEMQYVEIELDPHRHCRSRKFHDDGQSRWKRFWRWFRTKSGIFGQLLNAGKRVLTGESLFMTALSIKTVPKEKCLCIPTRKILPLT